MKNNGGHNVFYMLPLLLGLIGLFFQAFSGKKGIESFWVTFFLFFMTGIAIVIYLNQTPYQPRERDYAYAGSFYAFGHLDRVGVAAIWRGLNYLAKTTDEKTQSHGNGRDSFAAVSVRTLADGEPDMGRPRPFGPLRLPRLRYELPVECR